MGREIKRVPMTFGFPIDSSFSDHAYNNHRISCAKEECDDECEWNREPPKGEGWQLWQTVSDGPISPVFATPEELIEFMCQPEDDPRLAGLRAGPWAKGWRRDVAERFVRNQGHAPSLVVQNGRVQTGVEAFFGKDETR